MELKAKQIMNDENQPAGSPNASPDFAGAKQSKLSSTDRKTIQPTEEFSKNISALDPSALNPAATAQTPSSGLSMPDQTAINVSAPAIVTPASDPEPSVVPQPSTASAEPIASPIIEPSATPTSSPLPTLPSGSPATPNAPTTTTIQEAPAPEAKKSGGLLATLKGLFKRK